jgi:hypothetical protein
MTKLTGAAIDRVVAHAMGLKSVNNCEKWGTSMTQEALKLALEALESCDAAHITDGGHQWHDEKLVDKAITAIKEALAQTQEPVAYDKTKMNCFVQDLYDKKMQEGKHGHYETMFHVVHQAIKKSPATAHRTTCGL